MPRILSRALREFAECNWNHTTMTIGGAQEQVTNLNVGVRVK